MEDASIYVISKIGDRIILIAVRQKQHNPLLCHIVFCRPSLLYLLNCVTARARAANWVILRLIRCSMFNLLLFVLIMLFYA